MYKITLRTDDALAFELGSQTIFKYVSNVMFMKAITMTSKNFTI